MIKKTLFAMFFICDEFLLYTKIPICKRAHANKIKGKMARIVPEISSLVGGGIRLGYPLNCCPGIPPL